MTDVVICACGDEKEVGFNDIGDDFVCEKCGFRGIIEIDDLEDGGYYFWIWET